MFIRSILDTKPNNKERCPKFIKLYEALIPYASCIKITNAFINVAVNVTRFLRHHCCKPQFRALF